MHAKALPSELPQRLLHEVSKKYGANLRAVFLVGSYARGEAHAWSDINLLVITEHVSEHAVLFSLDRPISLQVSSMEGLLTDLYAPEGQQVVDWWLLAGRLQDAVPWLDQDGLLITAQRIVAERRPLIELYSRILWDDQLALLERWRNELAQAVPFSSEYLRAARHFLKTAETALLIFHGKAVHSRDIGHLTRPKSFLADWSNVFCLGAEPGTVDLHLCFEALAQTVSTICNAGPAQGPTAKADRTDRHQLLGKLAGDAGLLELPDAVDIPPQLADQALTILWSAKAGLKRREPTKLVAAADRLWSLLAEAGLLENGPVLQAMRIARIPQPADSARVLAATERLQQGLHTLGQTPAIVPQPNRRRALPAQGV